MTSPQLSLLPDDADEQLIHQLAPVPIDDVIAQLRALGLELDQRAEPVVDDDGNVADGQAFLLSEHDARLIERLLACAPRGQ